MWEDQYQDDRMPVHVMLQLFNIYLRYQDKHDWLQKLLLDPESCSGNPNVR